MLTLLIISNDCNEIQSDKDYIHLLDYKWWQLANCKMSQFIKQQNIHFVNKHGRVTNILAQKQQQMAFVVCHSVFPHCYVTHTSQNCLEIVD